MKTTDFAVLGLLAVAVITAGIDMGENMNKHSAEFKFEFCDEKFVMKHVFDEDTATLSLYINKELAKEWKAPLNKQQIKEETADLIVSQTNCDINIIKAREEIEELYEEGTKKYPKKVNLTPEAVVI